MSEFKWRHFEGEIILWAVRWYCRYGISYRDLEQMMGVPVDHSTIYRWVQRYAPEFAPSSSEPSFLQKLFCDAHAWISVPSTNICLQAGPKLGQ